MYCPGDFTALSKVTLNEKDEVVISSAGAALDGSSDMPLCPSEGGTANCKRVVGKHKRPQADTGSFMIDDRIGLAMECFTELDPPEGGYVDEWAQNPDDPKSVCYGNCDYCETGWLDMDGLYHPMFILASSYNGCFAPRAARGF